MARVRMLGTISGPRAGQDWPARGTVIDLPDPEAADLVAMRMAEYAPAPIVADPQRPEPGMALPEAAAVNSGDAQTATTPRPRARTTGGARTSGGARR